MIELFSYHRDQSLGADRGSVRICSRKIDPRGEKFSSVAFRDFETFDLISGRVWKLGLVDKNDLVRRLARKREAIFEHAGEHRLLDFGVQFFAHFAAQRGRGVFSKFDASSRRDINLSAISRVDHVKRKQAIPVPENTHDL